MPVVERWDPFRDAVSLSDAFNTLVRESVVRPTAGAGTAPGVVSLPLDVVETENEYVVKASLPGVPPDAVQITVHNDTVNIRAETKADAEKKGETWHLRERRQGVYQRAFSLATPINADLAKAEFQHGVLTLTLPKAETAKPRQIKVTG